MSLVSKIVEWIFRVEYKGKTFSAIFEKGIYGPKHNNWDIKFPTEMKKEDREIVEDYLYDYVENKTYSKREGIKKLCKERLDFFKSKITFEYKGMVFSGVIENWNWDIDFPDKMTKEDRYIVEDFLYNKYVGMRTAINTDLGIKIRFWKNRVAKYEFKVEYIRMHRKDVTFRAFFYRTEGPNEDTVWKINFPTKMSEKDRELVEDYLNDAEYERFFAETKRYKAYKAETMVIDEYWVRN